MRTHRTRHRNLSSAASLLLSTEAPFLLPVLIAALGLMLAGRLSAQTFTVLHSFTAGSTNSSGVYTNIDGAGPSCGLILSGNTLYGTAEAGGSSGTGTAFKVNIDGTDFTTLYSFTGDSDGATPIGGLILSGNTLYGTAYGGGSGGNGIVFKMNTDGTGFTSLYNFTARDPITGINSDGAYPYAGLILSGNTLYGTAPLGGSLGWGTSFKVNTDGTDFTTLYSFAGDSDGGRPYAGLILCGNTLYGTASGGASSGNGTVFSLSLGSVRTPQLTIIRSGPDVILTWPTNATGFTLQSTTNLASSSVWTAVCPEPVVVNGRNTVPNPISATQQFFRLSQ